MPKTVTIRIPAARYIDFDDCLAAAAENYVEQHPEAAGWDLSPRWADEQRDEILLDVPGRFVVEGRVGGRWTREAVEAQGDATFDTEADAQAAIDDLVRVNGWSRTELRARVA